MRRDPAVGCLLLFIFLAGGLACGVKAPPVPRETVVPSPIQELAVRPDGERMLLEFVLPATRLDGGPLARIGGYRIERKGPDGEGWQREIRFSFSEQSAMVGRKVVAREALPTRAGVYRYTVVPLDAYGSHPGGNAWAEVSFDGRHEEADLPSTEERVGLPEALTE